MSEIVLVYKCLGCGTWDDKQVDVDTPMCVEIIIAEDLCAHCLEHGYESPKKVRRAGVNHTIHHCTVCRKETYDPNIPLDGATVVRRYDDLCLSCDPLALDHCVPTKYYGEYISLALAEPIIRRQEEARIVRIKQVKGKKAADKARAEIKARRARVALELQEFLEKEDKAQLVAKAKREAEERRAAQLLRKEGERAARETIARLAELGSLRNTVSQMKAEMEALREENKRLSAALEQSSRPTWTSNHRSPRHDTLFSPRVPRRLQARSSLRPTRQSRPAQRRRRL